MTRYKHTPTRLGLALVFITVVGTVAQVFAADESVPNRWPGFLGAESTPVQSIPKSWAPDANIDWTASLPGHGQSSPVIWGQQVYVTAIEGPQKDTNHILKLSLKDGDVEWDKTFPTSMPVENSVYVSRAAPTPVVDQNTIYASFESGDVIALSHAGELRWSRSLTKDYGKFKNRFGLSASPVQTDDYVIVLVDDDGPSYLLALDKTTGKTVWKTDRESRTSWSSPALIEVEGEDQVVISSAGSVDGYNPQNGERLWTFSDVGGNTAATPTPLGSGAFLVGASPGRNGENAEGASKSNMAIKIVRTDDGYEPQVLWRAKGPTVSFASPIAYQGFAYWVNRSGVVYCRDAKTGEEQYTKRIAQSCWATPLGVGGQIYFFGKDGVTTVLAAGPDFQQLSENQLWNPDEEQVDQKLVEKETDPTRRRAAGNFAGRIQYGIAASNNRLLIRTGDRLYCVGGQDTQSQ